MAGEMSSAPWRNRITRHADVAPSALVAHPLNFRRHPRFQADALGSVLDGVGVVQSVIVNERSGRILDGHLRVELAVARNEPTVPVVYVDLDDADERLILATFDPLGALAETNAEPLRALLADVVPSDDALGELLAALASTVAEAAEPEPPADFAELGPEIETAYCCPSCGYEWSGSPAP